MPSTVAIIVVDGGLVRITGVFVYRNDRSVRVRESRVCVVVFHLEALQDSDCHCYLCMCSLQAHSASLRLNEDLGDQGIRQWTLCVCCLKYCW